MYSASLTGITDSYDFGSQGVRNLAGLTFFRVVAWGLLTSTAQARIPLYLSSSRPADPAYPRTQLALPVFTIASASIRLPNVPNTGDFFEWGKHVNTGTTLIGNSNDKLAVVYDTASAAQVNTTANIVATGGLYPLNGNVRANAVTGTPLLGVAPTADGVIVLKTLTNAGTAFSASGIRVSGGRNALVIADIIFQTNTDALDYDDAVGIGREALFVP